MGNGGGYKRETLWRFLQEKADVKLVYDEELIEDPNNEDEVIEKGVLLSCVGLSFPKELLGDFKELFFEVLPSK